MVALAYIPSGLRKAGDPFVPKEQIPAMIISMAVLLIYFADRTNFWLKEQKQFNPWTFSFLCIFSLAVGLLTMRRADSDLGILNREQTDEWKGWMQSMLSSGVLRAYIHNYYSRDSYLPLSWSVQGFWYLQPH
jgi:hypothetical protein